MINFRHTLQISVRATHKLLVDQPPEHPNFVITFSPSSVGFYEPAYGADNYGIIQPLKSGINRDNLRIHKEGAKFIGNIEATL